LQELVLPGTAPSPRATPERLRRPGGGRKSLVQLGASFFLV